MPKLWLLPPSSPDLENISKGWGVPKLVGQILLNRGLSPSESPSGFLSPQLKHLYSPNLLNGASAAASLIVDAVHAKRKIVLYGDYDVDGIAGVALLWHMLRQLGADLITYVPHRVEEGYGLNLEAVRKLANDGAQLIVTVDCGITAFDVVAAARMAGCSVIVTDHHAMQERIPEADALVHPGLGDSYPNRDLCGAGVAFKLAWAVAQHVSGGDRVAATFRELLMELLPFAALGTIADVVPLVGENRVLARHGLEGLVRSRIPGVKALIASAGLTGESVSGSDVGFKLAPRINAVGRMGHARLAVELFTRADEDRAREIAEYLEEHNRSRQTVERRLAHEVYERIELEGLASDARRAIVVAAPGWHAGVLGIVAARVVDRYHRPAVLVSLAEQEGQGSARSIHSFDLAQALEHCKDHLVSYGGHAMAAGLRIVPSRMMAFSEAFIAAANQRLTGADLVPKLRLDAEVPLTEMNLSTAASVVGLGPFGHGNPKPRLATDWVELAGEPRCVGRNEEHLQATFRQNGAVLKGIGFGLAGLAQDLKQHRRCRVAFEPIINEYQGRRSVEMQVLDFQFPE